MDDYGRPRKQIEASGKAAGRRRSARSTKGVARGKLKGKAVTVDAPAGSKKPTVAAARRAAAEVERTPDARRELPLPMEHPIEGNVRAENWSLRLRLLVEGERITVLDAVEVDAPAPQADRVRGTNFVEVRAGSDILTVQPLVDPGVEIGIPDPNDTTEFRGHREVAVASWEVAVRVPLEAIDALIARDEQRRDRSSFEVAVYQASETIEVDPVRFDTVRGARGGLARVATSGRLSIDQVRAPRSANRKPEPGQLAE